MHIHFLLWLVALTGPAGLTLGLLALLKVNKLKKDLGK